MSNDEAHIVQAMIIGVITGLFSAGTIYGMLKTELRYIRRDLTEVRNFVWPERRAERKGEEHVI